MKAKLLVPAVILGLAGLYFLNRHLNQTREYIQGVPAVAEPGTGAVRQRFTVGFLPVT